MPWQLQTNQRSLALNDTIVVFGSDTSCAWRESHWRPKHARLRLVAGSWFLEAIDDAPLWINGQLAKNGFLKANDRLQLDPRDPAIAFSAVVAAPALPVAAELPAAPAAPVKPRQPPPPLAGTNNGLDPKAVMISAGISVGMMLLLLMVWRLTMPPAPGQAVSPHVAEQKPDSDNVVTRNHSPDPVPEPDQAKSPRIATLEESLVLIAVGNSGADAGTPVVLCVGWLISPQVVLFPRSTLLTWQNLEQAIAQKRAEGQAVERFLCAIQWDAIRIVEAMPCPGLETLAVARLAEPAEMSGQWAIASGVDCDLSRVQRQQRLRAVSYRRFTRTPGHDEQIIGMFDNNAAVVLSGRPAIVEEAGHEPHLASGPLFSDDGQELEKSGLLVVDGKLIAGLILPSGEILSASRLQHVIADAAQQMGSVAGATSR